MGAVSMFRALMLLLLVLATVSGASASEFNYTLQNIVVPDYVALEVDHVHAAGGAVDGDRADGQVITLASHHDSGDFPDKIRGIVRDHR